MSGRFLLRQHNGRGLHARNTILLMPEQNFICLPTLILALRCVAGTLSLFKQPNQNALTIRRTNSQACAVRNSDRPAPMPLPTQNVNTGKTMIRRGPMFHSCP
ncbi:hypothetical protein BDU57DRAFT_212030 [Ampelomyces quisqualis]|uniref:Uncharacterized protein n=1 Tax=Ampelomyces quisqualis TaxID=50730 RepID=A0A6A5QN90_AMPQU|nr:hypothetical protein BDU57DRAFT_212030 [Ampelomyces quisqualis]